MTDRNKPQLRCQRGDRVFEADRVAAWLLPKDRETVLTELDRRALAAMQDGVDSDALDVLARLVSTLREQGWFA